MARDQPTHRVRSAEFSDASELLTAAGYNAEEIAKLSAERAIE